MTTPPPVPYYPVAPPPPSYPEPGVIPLRPLGVSDIFGGAFATIRRNWRTMLLVPFVITLAVNAIEVPLRWLALNSSPFPTALGPVADHAVLNWTAGQLWSMAIPVIGSAVTIVLFQGVFTVTISRAVLGRPTTFGQALRAAGPRYLPLIGLFVIVAAVLAAALAVPGGIGLGVGSMAGGIGPVLGLTFLGILVGLGVAAYFAVTFTFATTALILEPQPIFRALSRSRWLVRGHWWRIFGIILLSGLIAAMVSGVVQMPISIWQTVSILHATFSDPAAALRTTASWPMLIASGVVATVSATLIMPFTAAVSVLLYHDQRIRLEGFHVPLAQMAGAATL
ncbi:MAG: hypothetical protein JOZ47_22895 [Kutzneria sp.]|nr:hypothetical protein [Kutzneria sp.]MBV9847890.1 hypothetical protein [Kutzneria sp.]